MADTPHTRHDLFSLFELMQLMRSQPMYGYALTGLPKGELSDLTQHHYLVGMLAWRLARIAKSAGGNVRIERTMELALTHDIGEIFGGDIAAPYARANPAARKHAKAFEQENLKFLAPFFGDDSSYMTDLFKELHEKTTDEARIVKIADFIEFTHYKRYIRRSTEGDAAIVSNVIEANLAAMQDPSTKSSLTTATQAWIKGLNRPITEVFEAAKQINHEQ